MQVICKHFYRKELEYWDLGKKDKYDIFYNHTFIISIWKRFWSAVMRNFTSWFKKKKPNLKIKGNKARKAGSEVKNIWCSLEYLEFTSSIHMAAHNHLQIQTQGVQHPFLASYGTRHTHGTQNTQNIYNTLNISFKTLKIHIKKHMAAEWQTQDMHTQNQSWRWTTKIKAALGDSSYVYLVSEELPEPVESLGLCQRRQLINTGNFRGNTWHSPPINLSYFCLYLYTR